MRDADQSTFDVGATVAAASRHRGIAASRHRTMPSRNAGSTAASTDRIDAHATTDSSPARMVPLAQAAQRDRVVAPAGLPDLRADAI
ncbi:hypothetical protein [Burkholderia cepacia]|uniref:hypothetical protein n=1 Tax=Burkholderia cepacia TaxID=292 RepID=UPI001CF3204E|nr:hypothetical protein [Burkholderia cepacia]MCA8111910.1 hypothetical protein [Burkholderia cepacia]MCA8399080.1 hypothetical protein [Burkholderia cepacia]